MAAQVWRAIFRPVLTPKMLALFAAFTDCLPVSRPRARRAPGARPRTMKRVPRPGPDAPPAPRSGGPSERPGASRGHGPHDGPAEMPWPSRRSKRTRRQPACSVNV
jgi:hypothetical protein